VSGVQNPSDLEALTSILDRSSQMKHTRVLKERQLDKLKDRRQWF